MMWYFPEMGWGMVASGILSLAFLVALILLIVWGVKQITGRSEGDRKKALEIAKERYARGEITKEAFEQLKKDIT